MNILDASSFKLLITTQEYKPLLIESSMSTRGNQSTGLWGKPLKIFMKPKTETKKTDFYVCHKGATLIFALPRFVSRSVVQHCSAHFGEHGYDADESGGISLPN